MTLSERITELEQALVEAHARVSGYERAREIVPEQLRGRVERLEADLGWLRELDSLRVGTFGVISHWDNSRATYEELVGGAHLRREIEELEQRQDRIPPLIVLLTPAQQRLLIARLRELRLRRIAMKREPDDERNAAGDVLCPDCREITTGGKLCPVCAEGRALWEGDMDSRQICPIPPACTCELVDSSRDELPDGGPCPLSGWVAPRLGDGCPVHGDDDRHR